MLQGLHAFIFAFTMLLKLLRNLCFRISQSMTGICNNFSVLIYWHLCNGYVCEPIFGIGYLASGFHDCVYIFICWKGDSHMDDTLSHSFISRIL